MKTPLAALYSGASPPLHIHRGTDARVGIFVDAENIFVSLQEARGDTSDVNAIRSINYGKLITHCLGGRTAYCARFYDVTSDHYVSKAPFLAAMQRHFEVFTKPLSVFPDGRAKGDWDVGIAVDMIDLSDKLDVIVLCSGDGDFIPVVKYLQRKKHCRVEGVSFRHSTSSALIGALDAHTDLSSLMATDLFK